MGNAWDKFRLLMWKNWLLQWRHRRQTIIEILVPVLFSLLLVIIRTLVDIEIIEEPTTYSPFSPLHFPQHNFTIDAPGTDFSYPNDTILSEADRSRLCYYLTNGTLTDLPPYEIMAKPAGLRMDNKLLMDPINRLSHLMPGIQNIMLQQWILVYSPNSPVIEKFMKDAAEVVSFIGCGVRDGATLQHLFSFPASKLTPTDIALAGVAFDDNLATVDQIPDNLNVAIRFPGERRIADLDEEEDAEGQSGGRSTLNWMTKLLFPLFQRPGPRNQKENDGGSPGYYKEGFLAIQTAISQAMLKTKGIQQEKIPTIQLQRFPYPPYVDDPLLQAMEAMVPLIIMLSFVYSAISTVRTVTTEKERQLKEAMKMMGLPNWLHWSAWFVKTLLFFLVSVILITVLLKAPLAGSNMYVLAESDWSCLLAFLFCFIVASVTFCFAVSSFFSQANTGAIVGGLIWFLCYFPYVFLQNDYANTSLSTKLGISVFSNTAMAYGFQIILMYEGTGAGLQWHNLWTPVTPTDTLTMGHIMGMLLVDAIIYMIITIYVEGVFPGTYGVPLPWYFPFTKAYWLGEPLNTEDSEAPPDSEMAAGTLEPEPRNLTAGVRIQNLRKIYANGKVAVHGLSLNLYEGQITVLLGHNGAGKTTTMSMLTGMYTPTSGTATICDHDIRTDMKGARESLGLCPQHNILFDELSVKEHLVFFGRLKGFKGKKLEEETTRFIEMLELVPKTNSPASSLSGGMKRKLAAAVALCGDSKVVLFDEPTSGMDPAARRAMWDLLQSEKAGRTVLLTTHFMDEADLLGDRIAIMSEGRLRAIGSSFFLKKKYGGGYSLVMVKDSECKPHLVTELLARFIPGIQPTADIGAELSYHLDDANQTIFETMFNDLEEKKGELGISSYGVSLTTMEEVFMKVGSEHEVGKNKNHNNNVSAIALNGSSDKSNTILNIAPVELLRNPRLLVNQAWAMLLKYATSTARGWILYVIIILIPIIDLTIAILVGQTFTGTDDLPTRAFTLADYNKGVATVAALEGADGNLVKVFNDLVTQDSGSLRYLNDMKLPLNVSDYILNESVKDVGDVSQTFIVGTTFESSRITAMFNNQPLHTPALALSYIYNALLKASDSKYALNIVNSPLPYTVQTTLLLQQQGGNMGFQIAFNLGFSFAFVASYFAVFYIRERVSKAKHLQFVSGVNVPTFWTIAYIWDLLVSLGPILAIIITLAAFQEDGFSSASDLGRAFAVMLCGMLAILPLSYIASFWFEVAASGFSRLIMLHVFTGVAAFIVVMVMKTPSLDLVDTAKTLDWIFTFLPAYSLTYSFYNLNTNYLTLKICQPLSLLCGIAENVCCQEEGKCGSNGCVAYTSNYFAWEQPGVGRNMIIFIVDGAVLFIILMIIEHRVWEMITYKSRAKASGDVITVPEDPDVRQENQRVADLPQEQRKEFNLLLQNVTKFYGNFQAVNNLNLGVKQGECFGLLGVNGAGKTTTFKMLTGDEIITIGDAYVKGLSLKYQMKQVHQLIGYCPQFDALLDDLTGRETLRIFCLLRGVPTDEVSSITTRLAKELLFESHIDKKVKEYSGGNKRKLSTAVALVGDPPVVYLDEPTTGMDPVAKRHLWDVICKIRDMGKTIILTSHSMEECEALCTRLAIMVNGEFKCLGSTQHLKDKYAEGYTLTIKVRKPTSAGLTATSTDRTSFSSSTGQQSHSDNSFKRPSLKRLDSAPSDLDLKPIKSFVQVSFAGAQLREEYQGLLTYQIPRGDVSWARMFGLMETAKSKLNIEDYSLGQTSLEQVFLSFTKYQNTQNMPEQ